MRYSKLILRDSSPEVISWKDNFISKFSECSDALYNYSTYTASCIKHFFMSEILDSLQYYCSGLYYSWDSISTYATVLTCTTILACLLLTVYHGHILSLNFKKAERSLKDVNKMLTEEIGAQAKIEDSVNISSKVNEDINMAVYMSEKRRKSKEKRPERPTELEDRAPELMPGLRAERCVKNGVAMLNITEDTKNAPEKTSGENVDCKSLKSQNGISQHENDTLDFENDKLVDDLESPCTNKIVSPEVKKFEGPLKSDINNKNCTRPRSAKKKSEFENNYSSKSNRRWQN